MGTDHDNKVFQPRYNAFWVRVALLRNWSWTFPSVSSHSQVGKQRNYDSLLFPNTEQPEFTEHIHQEIFPPGDSIESFAFDPSGQRFAIASHYGQLKVFRVDAAGLTRLWEDKLPDVIPRAVFFADQGASVIIYTMETGTMHVYFPFYPSIYQQTTLVIAGIPRQQPRRVVVCSNQQCKLPCLIWPSFYSQILRGNVDVCGSSGNIVIDNMSNGFDLYPPNRNTPTKTFKVDTNKTFVKAGVFAEKGKTVVCGSDHGKAYIFGTDDGKARQILKHGGNDQMIQAVEVRDNILVYR